ncbi:Udp-glycosyltransferase 73b4, partial [Thalictrum thalictroides]
MVTPSEPYIKWLDDRDTHNSVIYVSFGSRCDVPDVQLDEVAYGLEMSGHPFIWVARSETWALPDGMEDRIKGRGWIVRDWVDQRSILAHPAIGGFVSPSEPYLKWLDDRDTHNSVIYVSFGSRCDVPDVQLDEVAYGLEMSGHPFIWVARSETWALPDGMEDRIK